MLSADDNKRHLAERGYESATYLAALRLAALRQMRAAEQTHAEIHARYVAAVLAHWERITDEEIMASEELREALVHERLHGDMTLYYRLHRLLPKAPHTLAGSQGGEEDVRPSYELHLYDLGDCYIGTARAERPTREQALAAIYRAVVELGEKWALGRRLIKLRLLIPDAPPRHKAWVEYEPATGRARLMEEDYDPLRQLCSGDLDAVLVAAEVHTRLVQSMGR